MAFVFSLSSFYLQVYIYIKLLERGKEGKEKFPLAGLKGEKGISLTLRLSSELEVLESLNSDWPGLKCSLAPSVCVWVEEWCCRRD